MPRNDILNGEVADGAARSASDGASEVPTVVDKSPTSFANAESRTPDRHNEEPEQVTIGIQGEFDDEPTWYQVKRKVVLEKILQKYAAKVGGGPGLKLFKDGIELNLRKSMKELNLKEGDVMECSGSYGNAEGGTPNNESEEPELVTIGIKGNAVDPAWYRVKQKVLLEKILERHAAKVGGGPNLKLYKDGKKLVLKKSIKELKLKEGDIVECYEEQVGGGMQCC